MYTITDMSNIQIITLQKERWRDYKEIRLEALREEPHAFGTSFSDAEQRPDFYWIERIEESLEGKTDYMLFAECDGRLVGILGAYFHKTPETQKSGHLWGMYVQKEFRGKGVGSQLMKSMLKKLQQISILEKVSLLVNQEQTAAVNLYKQLGFEQVGTEEFVLGDGKLYKEYKMERMLV